MVSDKEIVISSLVVMRCKLPPSGVDGTKVLEMHTMGCVIRAGALANTGRWRRGTMRAGHVCCDACRIRSSGDNTREQLLC